jgi:hypothetical protein
MELQVILDFACHKCAGPVKVTLKCTGQALALKQSVLAEVSIACPHCGRVNRLTFDPNGNLHGVAPGRGPLCLAEFSRN